MKLEGELVRLLCLLINEWAVTTSQEVDVCGHWRKWMCVWSPEEVDVCCGCVWSPEEVDVCVGLRGRLISLMMLTH